jgi:hypothetical protein
MHSAEKSLRTRRGPPFCDPMDLFWQINPEEMLSGLMVTTFLILLDASVVVVCSIVMFLPAHCGISRPGNSPTGDMRGPDHHFG